MRKNHELGKDHKLLLVFLTMLLLGVFTLVVAGCGGGTTTSTQATEAPATTVAPATTEAPASTSTSAAQSSSDGANMTVIDPPVNIKVGVTAQTFEQIPAYAGVDLGTWKKRGLNVEVVPFKGDAAMQQGFAAKSVEFGAGSGTGALGANFHGSDVFAISQIGGGVRLMVLVVDPKITSKADLAGKTLGATSPGSFTELAVSYLARDVTGDPKGIKVATLGALANQVAALKQGQTSGFVWSVDGAYQTVDQGVGKILLSFDSLLPHFAMELVAARGDVLREKPEVTKAFLEGWYEAQDYLTKNKQYTVDLLQSKMDFTASVSGQSYDFDVANFTKVGEFDPLGLKAVIQASLDTKKIDKEYPVEKWVNESFVPVQKSWK